MKACSYETSLHMGCGYLLAALLPHINHLALAKFNVVPTCLS
jgi:hypothetical protein